MYQTYNLRKLTESLVSAFPVIRGLYLFGSRRYRTGSLRSDLDILVELAPDSWIRPNELRAFSDVECPALDLFLADGGLAVSSANESRVKADTFESLVARLDAVRFWDSDSGLLEADVDWDFQVPIGVDFAPTALTSGEPFAASWRSSLRAHFRELEAVGLPTKPLIGSNPREIAAFLVEELRRCVLAASDLSPRGKGWQVDIKNEYDFQNLFFLSVKPWLPGLGREEVTIKYDGQTKTADFNLFGGQVIVELKHVRDVNTKASVVKTLDGLAGFYAEHPNVRVLILGILVDKSVSLDEAKWESDYSYVLRQPEVWTRVIREP